MNFREKKNNSLNRWSSFNYNFFYSQLDYLYLGAKQNKRLPATDTYGQMYSHVRGEYSIFFYKKMWLNYIKKINLLKKLYADPANNFFFITNRVEQIKFLSGRGDQCFARALLIDSAGQFSNQFYNKDSQFFFSKARGLGAVDTAGSHIYSSRDSNIFFTLANSPADANYFKFLTEISYNDFLTFSTADSDSIFLAKFVPLFGNNDNARA